MLGATQPRSLDERHFPLLITGVAGVAGFAALPYFQSRYSRAIVGVRPAVNARLNGPGIEPVDLEDPRQVSHLFRRHHFRSILHCGGSCALKSCELDPAMAQRVNIDSVLNLLECVAGRDVRFIHLSSDLVFSGKDGAGDYPEHAPTDPVTVYGKTMAQAERIVLLARPDALLLRISLPMGPSFNGHAGAIDWIASRFRKGKPATLYFDELRTPTYIQDMNRAFEYLLASPLSGIVHFGGPRKLSLYQIAQVVNRVGGFDPRLLLGCPRSHAKPIPPRAGNVSMDSTRLCQFVGPLLGPWPADDACVPDSPDWHFDRSPIAGLSRMSIESRLYRYSVGA